MIACDRSALAWSISNFSALAKGFASIPTVITSHGNDETRALYVLILLLNVKIKLVKFHNEKT